MLATAHAAQDVEGIHAQCQHRPNLERNPSAAAAAAAAHVIPVSEYYVLDKNVFRKLREKESPDYARAVHPCVANAINLALKDKTNFPEMSMETIKKAFETVSNPQDTREISEILCNLQVKKRKIKKYLMNLDEHGRTTEKLRMYKSTKFFDPEDFVDFVEGDVGVILSVPHDGGQNLAGPKSKKSHECSKHQGPPPGTHAPL